MNKMENNVKKTFKCEICSKSFTDKSNLNVHLRIHSGEKPYKCEICSKAFIQKGALTTHKRVHTGEKPYKCEICSSTFLVKSNLIVHKRVHTGEKPYKCEICSTAFLVKSNLIVHKRIHTGEKPYKCDICSKTFVQKNNLDDHLLIHSEVKPYKCEICSKSYTRIKNLKDHIRSHTGEEPPYKCELYSEASSRKSQLNAHKRIHTGEKPFKCDFCSKAFTEKSTLTRHKRTHTGEKPYKCELCSKAFIRKDALTTHKRTHTDEKTHNIPCSTSKKVTLKKQPLSEDASTFKANIKENAEQSWKDLSNPRVDSKVQENSCDLASNAIGRRDCEDKGVKIVTETCSTNDDSPSTAGHLIITNVRSLQDFSSDGQSSFGTKEEKGNLNRDADGCSFETDVELGSHLEESCLPKSTIKKNKESINNEPSVNNLLGENAEPFFLKSEVILSDEEESHDQKS